MGVEANTSNFEDDFNPGGWVNCKNIVMDWKSVYSWQTGKITGR